MWAGKIISASTREINKMTVRTKEISPKKVPNKPGRKKKVEKAMMVVNMAETMGGMTQD